jgi:hypothetical protein
MPPRGFEPGAGLRVVLSSFLTLETTRPEEEGSSGGAEVCISCI